MIDIDALAMVLQILKVEPMALVYSYAIGGCDFTPASFKIPHHAFAKSLFFTGIGQLISDSFTCMNFELSPTATGTGTGPLSVTESDTDNAKKDMNTIAADIHIAVTAITYAMCRLSKDECNAVLPLDLEMTLDGDTVDHMRQDFTDEFRLNVG